MSTGPTWWTRSLPTWRTASSPTPSVFSWDAGHIRVGRVRKEPTTDHREGSHLRTTVAESPPSCSSTKSVPTDTPEISNPTASTPTEYNRVHETSLPPRHCGYCQKFGKNGRQSGHNNQGKPLGVLACVLPHVSEYKPLVLQGTLGGKHSSMLIDSGVAVSLIRSDMTKQNSQQFDTGHNGRR